MKRLAQDLMRVGVLFVLVLYVLIQSDTANVGALHAILLSMAIAGASHLSRRILFPSLDLQKIAMEAVVRGNLPAALVFLGLVGFLVVIALLPVLLLRP